MIRPNWDIFKAKFSDNPQLYFEWFCYILFCREYKKETGIFRYKNQSAIENEPITYDGEIIGWQAKFYDVRLSSRKKELIKTVEKSARDYPKMSKLIFYTNQEWAQSHANKDKIPESKKEIEKIGQENDIKIEWKTASFFESPFVSINNEQIARYFFSIDGDIFNMIKEKENHSENILREIKTSIYFNEKELKIDRKDIVKDVAVKIEDEQILIVAGDAGAGKTAVIKQLYNKYKDNFPIYIFKASEFEVTNINMLFGNFNILDFKEIHKEEEKKVVVIDSAEKLLDLINIDTFREFLSALRIENWTFIFTIRSNYLSDFNMQLIDRANVKPIECYIEKISKKELTEYASQYDFKLPKDEKLIELLKNPFYLSEYLLLYSPEEDYDYQIFKDKIWDKNIKKTSPSREICFMEIAMQRVEEGSFFVIPSSPPNNLDDLVSDGILGYESSAGYFITHDIYEEWALEKIINNEFQKSRNPTEFIDNIGDHLPIRRSFRKWLSEKLLLRDKSIEIFIEEAFEDTSIKSYWKDEILVSVLLSDNSDYFFDIFNLELKQNNFELLKIIIFLLRVACKEVDEERLHLVESEGYSTSLLQFIFTKPIGNGWKSTIKYIHQNKSEFDDDYLNIIIPFLVDWNTSFKKGVTTRLATKSALGWYNYIEKEEDNIYVDKNIKSNLIKIILYGSAEIVEDLEEIFDDILTNRWKKYSNPHYDLISSILTEPSHYIEILVLLPDKIIELLDLFWKIPQTTDEDDEYFFKSSYTSLEDDFGIGSISKEYYPSSAFQTPIYWLLYSSQFNTIKFLLEFINYSVEQFVQSDINDNEIEIIKLKVNDKVVNQYGSSRLWLAYRGHGSTPNLFESIHMALEKFLFELAERVEDELLEGILLYLLENSKSVSVTAVVTSVVIANHERTFKVATVLMGNKHLFFYDTERVTFENLSSFNLFRGVLGTHKIYDDERIDSNNLKHRKKSLENIVLEYQVFRSINTAEKDAEKRQEIIWRILDEYYLEIENNEHNSIPTWELYLARMDRRKMTPTVEEIDDGVAINFNPEIDKELDDYSNVSRKNTENNMKYISLYLWANSKLENTNDFKDYPRYENIPTTALNEVKEILTDNPSANPYRSQAIPGMVCSLLIRDYFDEISTEDRILCKDVVKSYSTASLRENYAYQIKDGVEDAISVLPIILEKFPEERNDVKLILLLNLFDPNSIGAYALFSDFSARAIQDMLWDVSFEDAKSIFLTYLYFKPKFNKIASDIKEKNNKFPLHTFSHYELINKFLAKYEQKIEEVLINTNEIIDYDQLKQLTYEDLETILKILPEEIMNQEIKDISIKIIDILAENLFVSDQTMKYNSPDYDAFFKKITKMMLSAPIEDVPLFIQPLLERFNGSKYFATLLEYFIIAEDNIKSYDNFWLVWDLFYGKIVEFNKNDAASFYLDDIIKSYLFASTIWSEGVNEWHPLTVEKKRLFKNVSKDLGDKPITIYSLTKLFNGVGQIYLHDGVYWISSILKNKDNLRHQSLDKETIYQLEKMMQMFIYNEKDAIKRNKILKNNVLVILKFLVSKGSVAGYKLRENIL